MGQEHKKVRGNEGKNKIIIESGWKHATNTILILSVTVG